MEHGDIDNRVVPRLLLVFENLLGLLPDKRAEAKVERLLRAADKARWPGSREKKIREACDTYVINEALAHRIWHLTWKFDYSIDLITWISEDFRDVLAERIDREDLPLGHITFKNQTNFTRELAYMPHVAAVYTPDPRHQFTFGSKGRVINPYDLSSLDTIGRF